MKKHVNKFIALLLCAMVLLELSCPTIYAMAADNSSQSDTTSSSSQYDENEDSTFNLVNSNIQISDDYGDETAYISEVPISDPALMSEDSTIVDDSTSRATVGDPMVYLTQKWLNQEYGDVDGFGSVPENGKTGWDTVYGLLRALQHELGISSLANSFGPTTTSLYSQNLLYRQDGVTDRKFAILQGALWCKGYNPGYNVYEKSDGTVVFEGVFDETVEQAIIELKEDAGLINPDGVVTVNVMKALMSMDTFKLLSSYGGTAEIREMQQRLNRKYEAYTGLTPCDGVYGRNTNKALIYALQAEEGLPTSVANGNFGNTTKLCCPEVPYVRNSTAARRYPGTSSSSYYTSSQISSITELLQFALLVNGFDVGEIDGVFDSGTQQAIRAFQKKMSIPQTGKADKTTWLSLFISCGDTSRSALAADCATILTAAKAKTLYDNGYRYIGRYLTGTYNGGISKAITRTEAQIIFDAGLNFFPIYQTSARTNSYFTEAQGIADANAAITAAKNLGIPANTIIYFAVDFDCMDYQITSNIIPYFKKVHEVMSKSIYRTGIYGTRNACTRVSNMGYACSSFVGDMSTGFSGNLGFSMPDNWAFDQFYTTSIGSGDGYLEIDKDGFSGRDHGVSRLEEVSTEPTIPEISFATPDSDTLTGPTINILGTEIPLFELELEIEDPLNDIDDLEITRNVTEGTVEISIGLAEASEDPSVKTDNYRNIKKMINTFGGETSRSTWNNYQKMASKLAKRKLKFGFEFDAQFAGIIKLQATQEGWQLIEGGLVMVMDAETSLSYPLHPLLYVKFQLEGSAESGFKFVVSDSGGFSPLGYSEISLALRLGLEATAVIASAYGGVEGSVTTTYEFPFDSFEDNFSAELNAALFLELQILTWERTYKLNFPGHQLYPTVSTQSLLTITQDEFELIDPIDKSISTYSITDPDVFSENMQVYCLPQVINLGNGKMFMAYVDDAQNRTAENRTMLMYSVYDGTTWSSPQPVLEDATGDFQPAIYADGNGGVHIVWQNATAVFETGTEMEDMALSTDIYYTHWNGTSFENTVAITDNDDYETGHKVVASGNNISVVWQQNSENDLFALSGTNTLYRKQYINGSWNSIETIASSLYAVNSIDTTYIGTDNVIAYSTKTTNDSTTISDLDVFYFDGTSITRITNDSTPDYSVIFSGNQLFWTSDNSIYGITNGVADSKTAVISNLSSNVTVIKTVENENGQKAIVWTQEEEAGVKFYGAYYNATTGEYGVSQPLSDGDDYIRGWDVCMLSDGQIELAYCKADELAEGTGDKPYGQIDLVQKSADTHFDVTVNMFIAYDGDIIASNDIDLTANVYNSGSEPISALDISISAADNTVVQTATIEQDIAVGASESLEFSFTLPASLSKTDYMVQITPHSETDVYLADNQGTFTIGYADLAIKSVQEQRTGTERQLKITVENQGFEAINTATLRVLNGSINGEVLGNVSITDLDVGEEFEYVYTINSNNLNSLGSATPTLYYILAQTDTEEAEYGNNTDGCFVYPDNTITLTAGTGGTVQGAGTLAYNSSATVIAVPNTGYIFAGWYENNKLLDAITEEYTFTVFANRTLEARFIPNDLAISDIEIFGTLEVGNSIAFTVETDGGYQPYQWEFTIYKGEDVCYSNNSIVNIFEWVPTEVGDYTIVARVTDDSGFTVLYSKQYSIT